MVGFGARLKEARLAKGYSQKELAARLEVSHTRLNNWEREVSSPYIDTLIAICKELDVKPSWLMGFDED